MLYFKGCVVREKLHNISDATETILNSAGVNYTIMDNEPCCGSVLMRTGFKEDAKEVMELTLNQLINSNEDEILVSCAGCYNTLKNDYNEFFGIELNVIHTSEFIKQLIRDKKIKVKKTPKKVTYHDPCHLGRHSGIYDEPREVIKETADLIEMNRNRERSRCCGAGAGVKSAFPDTAIKVASRRIHDAENTGADLMITTCSFCILNLENALEHKRQFEGKVGHDKSITSVIDVSELIIMGLEDEEV
jgi:heterodisulfide reductase subunit D